MVKIPVFLFYPPEFRPKNHCKSQKRPFYQSLSDQKSVKKGTKSVQFLRKSTVLVQKDRFLGIFRGVFIRRNSAKIMGQSIQKWQKMGILQVLNSLHFSDQTGQKPKKMVKISVKTLFGGKISKSENLYKGFIQGFWSIL